MKSCIKKILGGMSLTCILVVSSCSDDAQLTVESCFLKYIEMTQASNYYEVGLKSAQLRQDIKVNMDEQGNVLAEYGRH